MWPHLDPTFATYRKVLVVGVFDALVHPQFRTLAKTTYLYSTNKTHLIMQRRKVYIIYSSVTNQAGDYWVLVVGNDGDVKVDDVVLVDATARM